MLTFCCCFATRFVGTFYEFANERLPCIMYCESPFISKKFWNGRIFQNAMSHEKEEEVFDYSLWWVTKVENEPWLIDNWPLVLLWKADSAEASSSFQTNYKNKDSSSHCIFLFLQQNDTWLGTVLNLILTDFSHDSFLVTMIEPKNRFVVVDLKEQRRSCKKQEDL